MRAAAAGHAPVYSSGSTQWLMSQATLLPCSPCLSTGRRSSTLKAYPPSQPSPSCSSNHLLGNKNRLHEVSPTGVTTNSQALHTSPVTVPDVRPRQTAPAEVSPPTNCSTVPSLAAPTALFRFWHDAKCFKGDDSTSLVQAALVRAGGVRTGGVHKMAEAPGPLGWQRTSAWDLLWSPSAKALKVRPPEHTTETWLLHFHAAPYVQAPVLA